MIYQYLNNHSFMRSNKRMQSDHLRLSCSQTAGFPRDFSNTFLFYVVSSTYLFPLFHCQHLLTPVMWCIFKNIVNRPTVGVLLPYLNARSGSIRQVLSHHARIRPPIGRPTIRSTSYTTCHNRSKSTPVPSPIL